MSKLFRRLVAVTLAIVMCFCIGTTVFAADTTDSENTSNINWWEIGWIILSDYVEKLIDLDGQSVKDSDWAYLVSPSVEYNTGDIINNFDLLEILSETKKYILSSPE